MKGRLKIEGAVDPDLPCNSKDAGKPARRTPQAKDATGIRFHFFTSKAVFSTPTGEVIVVPTIADKIRWKNEKNKLFESDERLLRSFIARMREITTALNLLHDVRKQEPYDADHAMALIKSVLTDLRHFLLPKDDLHFDKLLELKSIRLSKVERERPFLDRLYAYWLHPQRMETVTERCCGYQLYSADYLDILIYGWIAHEDADKAEALARVRRRKGDKIWLLMASTLCHMMAAILAEYLIFLAAMFPKFRKWADNLPDFSTLNVNADGRKDDRRMDALVGQTVVAVMTLATDKEGRAYFKKELGKQQRELPLRGSYGSIRRPATP